jgi:hypothetical protein
MSKSTAFIIGLIVIVVMAAMDWVVERDFTAYVTAVVTLTSLYVGLQVANNGVKGATFNKTMWEKEHGDGSK